ncbi:tRNA (uridine(54)-C5)-methyltransferase TrmA [Reinekea marina]|uniref:tRNA/tmRNA (uracil-C(5))-methyltransferase n=1 Tax=Reinekea marina TaxID=1310421 RepID=A0ABV7WW55_9GAMM|nr:tRNA (uridine(54)-C5)-methyltransferase TrmA [Reinekea marina]MDN3649637.1 tRNA (uridine(54)-C5)-methyltransferase TrmA [Reinekea marina]
MPFPFAPEQYEQQLTEKSERLTSLLANWNHPSLEVFRSETHNYRMRAEFRYWHEGDRSFYAMFAPEDRRTPVEVTDFPVASTLVNELMTQVNDAVHEDDDLRRKLFQVEFLTTTSGDALITLIYHRQLDDQWQERAKYWQSQWGFPVIGRARKLRLVLERDYVQETLSIAGKSYHFRQYENGFTQPNAGVCQHMVSWAVQHSQGNSDKDLMEMYCGNGNFSIPMAQNFRKALGTEISRTSVNSAQENIELNNIENLKIARMASEDLSNCWIKGQQSRRFNEFDIDSYDFDTVLVDPPRAGLDETTIELLKRFRRIVYVSCNPESMVANIESLKDSYNMTASALFDQFPYTHHMEAGVVLERKDS